MTRLLRRLLELLLPSRCAFCRTSVGASGIPHFCSTCWSDFSFLAGSVCPCCGRPFPSQDALTHSPDHECLACRQAPPQFDQALSIGSFEGPLREAIHQYKYRPCRALGKLLGEWMAGGVRVMTGIDVVMPVPLHRARLRTRGFNQSLLLAHRVAERHQLPLSWDNLTRIRPTRPQVELSGKERSQNVKGAFGLRCPAAVESKRILLVDDVFTTGATLNECASELKRAGAAQVIALTLARTE